MWCDFWLGSVSSGNDLPNKGGISAQCGICLDAVLRQQKTQGDGNREQYERGEREYTFLYDPECLIPSTLQGRSGSSATRDGTILGRGKLGGVNPRPYPIRFYRRRFLDRVEGDAYRGEGLHGGERS